MTARQGTGSTDPVARRSLEILDQMDRQLQASLRLAGAGTDRLQRLHADLARLVHHALHDLGSPDIAARIRDCYRRCAVDIDDTMVLRKVRGVIKGELRKAGVDTALPGVDPALDAATIILTTRRTIQRMGGASSSSAPGPALDRKTAPAALPPKSSPPARTAPGQAAAKTPATAKSAQPTTAKRKAASQAEMQQAFDALVEQTLLQIRRGGRTLELADYLAAVYNDPAGKERFLSQLAAMLPHANRTTLGQAADGFFRNGFKGSYIERADRQGQRRALRR